MNRLSRPSEQIDYQSLLKQGYLQLQTLQAKLAALEQARGEPIAIVGIGCRFPGGADGPERFWQRLRDGFDGIREVPPDRWDMDACYDPDPAAPGKIYARRAGLLDGVDTFDASFFGVSPRECESMDPQQRLLLEVAWEAIEDAGLSRDTLAGTQTGTYVGVMFHDYGHLIASAGLQHVDTYFGTGNGVAFLSGRLSYHLGLQGPSLVIDTACSSSLVAVHLACQSLRSGESDLALACGVNLILSPLSTLIMCKLRALAPDGRCKTFDAAADGYVRGEGCGVVVLKRLSDAMAKGDRILALVRGSAVNQDGASAGLTVPNGLAQQAVIRRALAGAGVTGRQVGYVEAHGTGTRLGDPLEARSMWAVLREGRGPDEPLTVGSLKTNVGHMEGAAGVGALIKTVLALQHSQIPPHLHFTTLNPLIAEEKIPLCIPTRLTPFPAIDGRRIAGVSSFGLSGTNAHVILEEAPVSAPTAAGPDRPAHLLCLSARSEAALNELVQRYGDHLAAHPDESFADVCFTVNTGRTPFEHRLAIVAANADECGRKLKGLLERADVSGTFRGQADPSSSAAATITKTSGDREWAAELERLAALYVRGGSIDWNAVYGNTPHRRVSLPTYPFQRQRYWIDLPAARPDAPAAPAEADGDAACLYETKWHAKPCDIAPGADIATSGDVLVLTDVWRAARDIAGQLESPERNVQVVVMRASGTDAHGGDRLIDPSQPAELASVVEEAVKAAPGRPLTVLYLWGLDTTRTAAGKVFAVMSELACVGLLHLVQALMKVRESRPVHLWVVTRGTQAASPDDRTVEPDGAMLWGFGRVISLECPDLWGGLIDLPSVASTDDGTRVAAAIQGRDVEDQVAYRGGQRYVPRLERCTASLPALPPSFRADAAYWITGGLGALGLQLAQWLIQCGARHLVLQGRKGLPDRRGWASLSADDGDVFRRVSAVRDLETLGATVEIVAADVADPAFVADARELLRRSRHPLRGVLHAAGVSGVQPLKEMTADELVSVLRAKVQGTWNLHELTREMELDFFVGFSSIASVWGSRGLGHYAAANAFLDAFARYRRACGLPALSVNWGPLAGGGMRLDEEQGRLRRVGIKVLAQSQFRRILGGLIQDDCTQVTVADVDWGVFKPIYQAQRPRPLLEHLEGVASGLPAESAGEPALTRERLAAVEPAQQRQSVEAYLLDQVARALKTSASSLDAAQPLTSFGVDSLMAMELQARVRVTLGVDVPIARFLEGRSIAQLSGNVVEGLQEGTSASLGPPVALPAQDDLVEGEI